MTFEAIEVMSLRQKGLIVLAILGVLLLAGFISTFLKKPQYSGDWLPQLAEVATFVETGPSQFLVKNVRAWEYQDTGLSRKEWTQASINSNQLREVWFFVEPFTGNALFAHSFLSFVFEDETGTRQTLSVSVEARKEVGQEYSPIRGLFREYELLYLWSTEKDILTRIAINLDHSLYAYKLNLPDDKARMIFEHFMVRTNDLSERPRFYNTWHSNCTNELAKAVNDVFPGLLPWHRSWVMTGRSAAWLHKLGFIDDEGSFEKLTESSDIQPLVKAHVDDAADSFSVSWRASYQAK